MGWWQEKLTIRKTNSSAEYAAFLFTAYNKYSNSRGVRKILIATPLRGDIPPYYNKTLFEVLSSKLGVKFIYAFLGGTTVQWARDELASIAKRENCTEIASWDADLEPTLGNWNRLLSHDVPVVCALYTKRHVNTHWHVHGKPGAPERADGLVQVNKSAIGFSKIKIEVFDKLREAFPERVYWKADAGVEPTSLHEFFPMGIIGPNSHVGKLKRIKEVVSKPWGPDYMADKRYGDIKAILDDKDYSTNQLRGEDFYFCELLEEIGIPMYVDTQLIIPHNGDIRFPIPTQVLMEMLNEPWRADEVRALQTEKPTEELIPT